MLSLKDFYISDSLDLEQVETAEVACADLQSAGLMGREGISDSNWIVFSAPKDLLSFALFKSNGATIEIVSPFGKIRIKAPHVNLAETIGFACFFDAPSDGKAFWGQSVNLKWKNMAEVEQSVGYIKAKRITCGVFEPLSTVISTRGLYAGLTEHAIVLLPTEPHSIKEVDGACSMESDGQTFVVPKGKTANLVLKGKVQWGTPNEKGVFVLGEMPV